MKPIIDIEDIVKYENDEMSRDEEIVFFQSLVDSGLAWSLQGHYGRTAVRLIEEGVVHVHKNQ